MDIQMLTDLSRIAPEIVIVLIFIWASDKAAKEFIRAMEKQADMFMKLITTMESENRKATLSEADAFRRTIENMAKKWEDGLEKLAEEVKALTRWVTFLAGRTGGPTLDELSEEEREIKRPRR